MQMHPNPSLRFSIAETAVLSSVLDDMREGNKSRNYVKPKTHLAFAMSEMTVEARLSCQMAEVASLREKAATEKMNLANKTPLIDHFGDKGLYTGELSCGEPHGCGHMKYDDGRVFEGKWCQGRFNGKGKLNFCNGDTYKGD